MILSATLALALTVTPGPVDWDALAYPGYAFDCQSETLYSIGTNGNINYFPALDYEVLNACGHYPTIQWADSDYENGPVLTVNPNAPVTPEPAPPTPESPAPVEEHYEPAPEVVALTPILLAPITPLNHQFPEWGYQPV